MCHRICNGSQHPHQCIQPFLSQLPGLHEGKDWGKAKDHIKVLEKSGQFVPQELYDMARRYENMQRCLTSDGSNRVFFGKGRGRNNW